jgi:cytochrome c553
MVRHGFEEFHEMCVVCHGAPGVERSALGEGINPKPPDLAKEAAEWSNRELFWITKHGIKLAGMPAFGVTHTDQDLWGIVAFLRRLQNMSPAEYHQLAMEAEPVTHTGTAETHASGGVVEVNRSRDREGTAHSHTGAVAGPTTPSRRAMPVMEHDETPHRPTTAGRSSAAGDSTATEKLRMLTAELLRDPIVAARIRADSSLRRRWETGNVAKQLARPPR